eukprot:6531689-Lingulodinium_polyedra.AAC.1
MEQERHAPLAPHRRGRAGARQRVPRSPRGRPPPRGATTAGRGHPLGGTHLRRGGPLGGRGRSGAPHPGH